MDKIRVALRPLLRRELQSETPIGEEALLEVEGLLSNWLSKRLAERSELEQRIFCLYVGGLSAETVARKVERTEEFVRQTVSLIGLERKVVLEKIKSLGEEVLNPVADRVQDQLRPIVKKLQRASLEAIESGDVAGKDAVKAFNEASKLLATLTGELVERKQVEVGANEAFKQIMQIASGFQARVIESEYKLLE